MFEINENIVDDTNSILFQGLGVSTNMFYGALPIHFELAKQLRNNQTEAELFLWNHLGFIKICSVRFK